MIAGVLATLQMRGVILLLEQLESAQVIGWYAAASRVVEAVRLLPQAMFGALFPALSALVTQPTELRRAFRWAFGVVVVYGIFGLFAAILFDEWLLITLFGDAFRPSTEVFVVLMAALILGLIRATLTLWFYAFHREWLVNCLTFLALVGQLVVGVVLINRFGLAGAGWTVLIGEALLVSMMGWVARQKHVAPPSV
jgi:O-antigen/teichoic acid export membrane protein